jgi:hypothetical protein
MPGFSEDQPERDPAGNGLYSSPAMASKAAQNVWARRREERERGVERRLRHRDAVKRRTEPEILTWFGFR